MKTYTEEKTVKELEKLLHGLGHNLWLSYDREHEMVHVYRTSEKKSIIRSVSVAMDNPTFIVLDVLQNIL